MQPNHYDSLINELLQSDDLYSDIFEKHHKRWRELVQFYPNSTILGRMLIAHFADNQITSEVLGFFLEHHKLNAEIVNQLFVLLTQASGREKATESVLKRLVGQSKLNSASQQWLLEQLTDDDRINSRVLEYLAGNLELNEVLQLVLANTRHPKVTKQVLINLAGNHNLARAAQQQLLDNITDDKVTERVIECLAGNPNLDITIQRWLFANIGHQKVTNHVLAMLAGNPNLDITIQRWLLANISSKKVTAQVLECWAGNSNLIDEAQQWILDNISNQKVTAQVRENLAGNSNLAAARQQWLLTNIKHNEVTERVLERLAGNTNLADVVQQQLLINIEMLKVNELVLNKLFGNPCLNAARQGWLFDHMAHWKITELTLVELAGNPELSNAAQRRFQNNIAHSKINPQVLNRLAANSKAITISTVHWFISNYGTESKITNIALQQLSTSPHCSDEVVVATIAAKIMTDPKQLQLFANILSSVQLNRVLDRMLQAILAAPQDVDKIAELERILTQSPMTYLVKLGSNYNDTQLAILLKNLYSAYPQLHDYPIDLSGRNRIEKYLMSQLGIFKNNQLINRSMPFRTAKNGQAKILTLTNQLEYNLEQKDKTKKLSHDLQ